MHSEITPEGDEFRHPFFVNPLTYYYCLSFHGQRKRENAITYSSPHEILLNLPFFQGGESITYTNRTNNQEVFTITIDRFKFMLVELIYDVSQDELELLYMRLLLANQYKKTIIDRGRFLQHDLTLKKYLLTIKGGYDSHLAYEKLKVKLYFKYRRLSTPVDEDNIQPTDIRSKIIQVITQLIKQS